MTRTLVHVVPLLVALSAGCSKHATYGLPMPRDTVPTTNEPAKPRPSKEHPTQPPS
jgi:hypothetical protein